MWSFEHLACPKWSLLLYSKKKLLLNKYNLMTVKNICPRLIWSIAIGLLMLGLQSCRTGCGCPMAQTERGFQVTPKSSPTRINSWAITHEFIRGIKDASSHGIQPDLVVVVVKETVFPQVIGTIRNDVDTPEVLFEPLPLEAAEPALGQVSL